MNSHYRATDAGVLLGFDAFSNEVTLIDLVTSNESSPFVFFST